MFAVAVFGLEELGLGAGFGGRGEGEGKGGTGDTAGDTGEDGSWLGSYAGTGFRFRLPSDWRFNGVAPKSTGLAGLVGLTALLLLLLLSFCGDIGEEYCAVGFDGVLFNVVGWDAFIECDREGAWA